LDSKVAQIIFQSCFDFPYHPDPPYQNYWKISFEK
jgi:hypothetical protein